MVRSQLPHRQIRALQDADEDTVTVYQAYQASIADAAVRDQRLNASQDFRPGRMTWVKPSWCWMMYRCGYSHKDERQARVLALKMRREHFVDILRRGVVNHQDGRASGRASHQEPNGAVVRVQWDPERDAKLRLLPHRSIQIGIPGSLSAQWAEEWIVAIEDVTDRARALKQVVDERPDITTEELVQLSLMPVETPLEIPDYVAARLGML